MSVDAVQAKAIDIADLDGDGKVDEKDLAIAKEIAGERAEEAKKMALAAYALAAEKGFFSHFAEYNDEILNPIKHAKEGDFEVEALKAEVIQTFKLAPTNPRQSFVLCNVIALLLGIIESLLMALLGHGIFSLLWNGAIGYAIAYTLYWTMTCSGEKKLMFYSQCFIVLYILFNVYMMLETAIYVVPAALYGTKAFVDVLQLINGFVLYKEVAGDKLML
jgi:hypothetical protein